MDTELVQRSAGMTDYCWWSQFTMDKEMGKVKGEAWRKSGKLSTRPDPMTGSQEEILIEYKVLKEWARMTAEELNKATLSAEQEAD